MSEGFRGMVPYRFDLSALVRRSVATLYSHLVTRPTGQALRVGIESQIGELGTPCLSILDFTQVVVLDYSCADEAIAKLIRRYAEEEGPAEVYFLARGVSEGHTDAIEAVLDRHRLALVVEDPARGALLLGDVSAAERLVWSQLEAVGKATAAGLAQDSGSDAEELEGVLERLARRRLVARAGGEPVYYALSSLTV